MAVKEGHTKSLMTSYNKLNGQYTNENEHLLVDILRKEWGYQGFIVTDWGGCNDRVAGIKATNALEMPSSGGESGKEIMKALKNGTLDENTLNERVDELLTLVFDTTKAFENKKPFDKEEHHACGRDSRERKYARCPEKKKPGLVHAVPAILTGSCKAYAPCPWSSCAWSCAKRSARFASSCALREMTYSNFRSAILFWKMRPGR